MPDVQESRYKRNDDHEDEDDSTEVEYTSSSARKKRKIPAMIMWYLPVIARLKCLFSNPRDSELMSWHFNKRATKPMSCFDTPPMLANGERSIPFIQDSVKRQEM